MEETSGDMLHKYFIIFLKLFLGFQFGCKIGIRIRLELGLRIKISNVFEIVKVIA